MITASAPGKIVVLGEYAVLESAPALVFAVNRRAIVSLEPVLTPDCQVSMGKAHENQVAFRISDSNEIAWQNDEHASQYAVFSKVWHSLEQKNLLNLQEQQGFHLNLDTDAFSDQLEDGSAKYGLGSSAALSAALAIVLAGRAPIGDELNNWLILVHEAHQAFQGGKGSGLDVAASLFGGAIGFKINDGVPEARALKGPTQLSLGIVWTGIPVSTTAMLAGFDRWKVRDKAAYTSLMTTMSETAQAALDAYSARKTEKFLQFFETYGNQLRILGEYSGLDIFSREHEAISRCADSCGVKYKTSGAGGGDIGIALSASQTAMTEFAKTVTTEGFRFLELAIGTQGVRLQ